MENLVIEHSFVLGALIALLLMLGFGVKAYLHDKKYGKNPVPPSKANKERRRIWKGGGKSLSSSLSPSQEPEVEPSYSWGETTKQPKYDLLWGHHTWKPVTKIWDGKQWLDTKDILAENEKMKMGAATYMTSLNIAELQAKNWCLLYHRAEADLESAKQEQIKVWDENQSLKLAVDRLSQHNIETLEALNEEKEKRRFDVEKLECTVHANYQQAKDVLLDSLWRNISLDRSKPNDVYYIYVAKLKQDQI